MPEADPNRIRAFATPQDFNDWLAEYHESETELWLKIYKKASGVQTVDWPQAVLEALCWGWIDGIKKSYDEQSYLQRFTPRRPKSIWSKKNCNSVEMLITDGRMQPAGLVHVTAAKADGRWDTAYGGGADATVPQDFLDALAKSPKAQAKFDTLNRQNLYAIYHRLVTAKRPETRAKRIANFVAMLERGETLY